MCASCENDFYIGTDDTQHYNCVREYCLHKRLALRPGQDVWEYIRNVRWVIVRYLEDVPNSCLRFEDNKVPFILLILKGPSVALLDRLVAPHGSQCSPLEKVLLV